MMSTQRTLPMANKPSTASAESPKAERIRVYLRSRPLTQEEIRGKDSIAATVTPASNDVILASRVKDAPSKSYHFDGVFTENSDQKHVYETVVAPAVSAALEGYNCTVFAYGQTGTGKTFTMEGGLEGGAAWSADHPDSGMIPRAVRDVFSHLQGQMDAENSVRVSHMELFNEELIDLLGGSEDKPLRLFEHPKDGVTIHNLEQVPVTSADAIFKILRKSSLKRQEAATKMNASSSRSHCIFSITVHTKESTGDGGELIRIGRLNLIDLAGSENVAKSGIAGDQKRETGAINQSLLVLGRVLTGVAENRAHVPYRESKLTRIMADSIGGKTKCSMIACITQSASSYDETQATLEYAAAARKIKNKPEVNAKITKKAVIKEYLNEIERLKMQVTAAREKNGVYLTPEEFKTMQEQIKGTQEAVVRLEEQLAARTKQLDDVSSLYTSTSEKLRETSEDLQVNQSDLLETRAKLADAQASCDQLQDLVEEHSAVIRHREHTEKSLHSNASQILSALQTRERDVEGLHAKVARKAAVEDENKAIKNSFRTYVAGKVVEMDGQLKRFRQAQSEHFVTLKTTVQSFMEEKTADMDKLCEKLDAFQAALQESQIKLSANVSSHCADASANLEGLQQEAADGTSAVSATVARFVASSASALDEWRQQLATQRAEVTEWGVNTAASIQVAIDSNDEWSAAHQEELQALVKALEANTKASLAWAEEHRRSIEGALKAHKERIENMQRVVFRQISDLVSGYVVAQHKALTNQTTALQEATTKQVQASTVQHETRAKVIEQSLLPSVEARQKKLQGDISGIVETVNAHCTAESKRIETDENRGDAWIREAETMRQGVAALHEQAEIRSQVDAESAHDSLREASETQRSMLDNMVSQTAVWRDEATEFEMVSRASIEEQQAAVEANIKALEAHTVKYGEGLQSEVSGVQDQFFHYFDSLHEDAPTGQTPVKRDIPHPKVLPHSLPEEQIIAEYQRLKAQNPSAAAATSSMAEDDEFADFAAATTGDISASTPKSTPQATPAQSAIRSSVVKPVMTDPRAPKASNTQSDPLADKKAAVKAQRQQQQQQQQQQQVVSKQVSKPGAAGGPQRAALAPLNRQSSVTNVK